MGNNIVWHNGEIESLQRFKLLGHKGLVLWMTGLSGSGKSTLAVDLEKRLYSDKILSYRLDGDNIRHGLNSDLGFSEEDRYENIRRIAEVAKLFSDAGLVTIVSFITPLKKMRNLAQEIIGNNFREIFVKCSISECIKRDPKGLYQKALTGEIKDFTGIDAPFEEPDNPFLRIDTETRTLEDNTLKLYGLVKNEIKIGYRK